MQSKDISGGYRRAVAGSLLLLLSACGGGSGGTSADPGLGTGAGNQAQASTLVQAAPGDLLAYFRTRLAAGPRLGVATLASASAGSVAAPSYAGTQVQEQGVDEDDLIKTDGGMVYALHPGTWTDGRRAPPRLTAHQRQADSSLSGRGSLTLNADFIAQGMYLPSGLGRLAVLGQRQADEVWIAAQTGIAAQLSFPFVPPSQRTLSLEVFRASGQAIPESSWRVEIDGSLVGSRMIGSVLYVVSSWTPDTGIYLAPADSSPAQVSAAMASLSTADLLPRIRVNGGPAQPLVGETDCFVQPANASPIVQLTTITAVDLSAPGVSHRSHCFAGGIDALYMSSGHVYLASSRSHWSMGDAQLAIVAPVSSTDIHKFSLRGMQVDYRGSGEVAGHLGWDTEKKPYRMSEHNGDLRVLGFTGETGWLSGAGTVRTTAAPESPATLTVLRENPGQRQLITVATLPNSRRPAALGKAGEQVYAVHYAGSQAYVVTFRRTDPLYVLDLSDPADPKTVGELKMPGYSDYLYPLPQGKLLGVGREATEQGAVQGLKLALFDVADPASPRLLASQVLGDVGSASALDYSRHGINLLLQGNRVQVALPVRVTGRSGGALTPGWQGLARYVADAAAGTLTARPAMESVRFDGTEADAARYARFDLAGERSVQTDHGVYYLSGGDVVYAP